VAKQLNNNKRKTATYTHNEIDPGECHFIFFSGVSASMATGTQVIMASNVVYQS
jgi:hypothetical protein